MLLEILLIGVGIAVVLWGADRFTDGACGLARKLNVSELVIGLTVVALGTSLPEFMVSFLSVLRGSSDMSVGNIIGSNIFNILFVTGITATIIPIPFLRAFTIDTAVAAFAALLLWLFSIRDRHLGRVNGIIMILCYAAYFAWVLFMK